MQLTIATSPDVLPILDPCCDVVQNNSIGDVVFHEHPARNLQFPTSSPMPANIPRTPYSMTDRS
jgi:hypothetical protein